MAKRPFRYRRRSLNTVLGVTKTKRQIKKSSGYYAATKPTRAAGNAERRAKRKLGYYSEPMRLFRWFRRKSK